MKKFCCLTLAIVLLFSLTACKSGNNGDKTDVSVSSITETVAFEKPANYTTVVLITINPQFKLYLDEKGEVLAVEPINYDAKSVVKDIKESKGDLKSVMKEIVSATNKGGFAKENATIKVEITEIKAENIDTKKILKDAKTTATESFEELEVTVTVETAVADNALNITSSAPATSSEDSDVSSDKAQNSSKVHTHTYTDATCTKAKTCSCGATNGKALGHNYKDGVCSRCKAKDKNYVSFLDPVANKNGTWFLQFVSGKTLNTVNFTLYQKAADGLGVSLAIGDHISTFEEDIQNDPTFITECEKYNGEYYYFGKGDGDGIKSIQENGAKITITDLSGNKLILNRISETDLKVISSPSSFACLDKIPVGAVLKFEA